MITYYFELDKVYNLSIVDDIPIGLPEPKIPQFNLFLNTLPDSIVIAIISFASSISAAELYAKKHNYKINPNMVRYT